MIPKKIHYCWFGGNPLPELALKCIESWKKYLPDYEIIEWNEQNYDVHKIPYISQAYNAKKYAFVSDYARFDILYQYGGLYVDTDVELIKNLEPIIEKGAFIGIEKGSKPLLATGLGIASPAASDIYREILDSYQNENFLNQDGSFNLKTVVVRVSDIFKQYGFVEKDEMQYIADTTIYPSEYFCPKDFKTGDIIKSDNTYTIHHYDSSWFSVVDKKFVEFRRKIYAKHNKYIAKIIIFFGACIFSIKKRGVFGFIQNAIFKLIKKR